MKVPTNYFPKLLYFFQLTKKGALIEAHENFVKGSERNRCYVMSDKGIERLSVPIVHNHGYKIPISEVKIDYTERWNIKHLRAIESYYRSAPYFEHYWDKIKQLLTQRYDTLFELNIESTKTLGALLGLDIDIKFTTDFVRTECNDDGFKHPIYYQVFSEKLDFKPHLSSLDYLFCEGKIADFFENLVENQRGIINAPIIK